MTLLEELQPHIAVRGILSEVLVPVVNVEWYGDNAIELTYKEAAAAVLVVKLGSKAELARCAAEALSYNALVQSFNEFDRLAKERGTTGGGHSGLFERAQ